MQLFVLGENRWRGERRWPPPGAEPVAFYLHSAGSANTVAGTGGGGAIGVLRVNET